MSDFASATTGTRTVDVAEAQTRWDDLIAGIHEGAEWLIVDSDGRTIAKLAPATQKSLPDVSRWKAFGMLKGKIEIADDFDEPVEDFKPYME